MNREQMIAWLTLEGWESTICGHSAYARHTGTLRALNKLDRTDWVFPYADGSNIANGSNAGWGAWSDAELANIMRLSDGYSRE